MAISIYDLIEPMFAAVVETFLPWEPWELKVVGWEETAWGWIIRYDSEKSHIHFHLLIPGPIDSGYGKSAPYSGHQFKVFTSYCKTETPPFSVFFTWLVQ